MNSEAIIITIICCFSVLSFSVGQNNGDVGRIFSRPYGPSVPGIPPGFDKILPEKVISELKQLHDNSTLMPDAKRLKFEEIMSQVPSSVLAKLPLAPIFDPLSETWKEKIRSIYANTAIPWADKHREIGLVIESMPPEVQKLLPPRPPWVPRPMSPPNNGFPLSPPPGFEKVLPEKVYLELVKIHRDPNMSIAEKAEKIDQKMRSLDQELLDKLPLPPGFKDLPEDKVKEARAIFSDKSLNFKEKDIKVADFVRSLSPAEQNKLRPPLPPVLDQLPPEAKKKIEEIFDNPDLDHQTRNENFWAVINSLPADKKMQVQDTLIRPPLISSLVPPPRY